MERSSFFDSASAGRTGVFWILLTTLIVFIGLIVGQIPYALFIGGGQALSSDHLQTFTLILMVLSFAVGLFALALTVFPLHRVAFISLITPSNRLDMGRIVVAFVFWFLLVALCECLMYLVNPGTYHWSYDPHRFWPLLLVALFWLSLQTSLEEIFFRGYLLQQVAVLTNHRWIAVVLTSVVFGLLHIANPEVAAFGITKMMLYYIGFGLWLGIITILDDRLELALGVHAATNVYGATVVTFNESAIQTPALITVADLNVVHMLWAFAFSAVLFFTYFAGRYQWRIVWRPSSIQDDSDIHLS